MRNPAIAEIIGLSVIIIGNRTRIAGRRANLVQIEIVHHLLYPKIFELAGGNRRNLRQKPLNAAGHTRRGIRRIGLRVCDIMLVADLHHLAATLYRHQKLPA